MICIIWCAAYACTILQTLGYMSNGLIGTKPWIDLGLHDELSAVSNRIQLDQSKIIMRR